MSSSDPLVRAEGLSKSYGPVRALAEASFTIPAGQVVGLLGPNGAGKTTAMKILTGYLAADAGRAWVAGHEVAAEPLAAKRCLGYLPENNPLYLEMRVADFLAFAHAARGLPRSRRRRDIDRVVVRTGLEPVFRRPLGECSKGYRQRAGLAQALLHDPPLLVLDEPTNGLDPNQVVEMRRLIRELGETKTVILTSHVLPEVEQLAGRVILIHRGRIVADGPLEGLRGGLGDRLIVRVAVRGPSGRLRRLLAAAGARAVRERPRPFGDPGLAAAEAELDGGAEALEALAAAAAAAGLPLVELAPQGHDLESTFRRLTAGEEAAA
ncbi:MAG: ATP-binding cassette domain-containing protein [Planctomycetota bacterium]|nr:MAG: ATP-binding cassette domain-containing protein [Planctomycetota bacterium]